jgi:DNA repair protein RecO (recombination protein O)
MKPRSFVDEGVVLARKNYGEADRILSVYTMRHGRVAFMARGIRRPKSRKRGHLEIFSHMRFSASRGTGLEIITEAEIIDNFNEIRKSLKKVSLAYYFMEVIGRITRESEPNEELFELILASLNHLKRAQKLKILRLNFVLELLTLLGFWPKGKPLVNPDYKLEEVIERNLSSARVGKKLVS